MLFLFILVFMYINLKYWIVINKLAFLRQLYFVELKNYNIAVYSIQKLTYDGGKLFK